MKKNQKLLEMMNELDDAYIEEAEKARFLPQKNIWKRVGGIAASLALVAAIGTFPLWGNWNHGEAESKAPNGEKVSLLSAEVHVWDLENGVFALYSAQKQETSGNSFGENATANAGLILEERNDKDTPNVLYPYITGDFESYAITQKTIAPNYVGKRLGAVTMRGEDGKTLEAELFAIVGVDTKCAVAVKYPQYRYCIFRNPDITFDTFADFKTAYSLDTELYMGEILVNYTMADQSETLEDLKSIAPLKAMILALEGKACAYEKFAENCDMKKSIGVNVAHGSQFVCGCGLQVFADGYLVTNLGGSIHIFDIGKEAASAVIQDAKAQEYVGVELYDKTRNVIEMDGETTAAYIPETSGAYFGTCETAIEETTAGPIYDVNQPSYEGYDPYARES